MIQENKRFEIYLPFIVLALMVYGLLVLRSAVLGNPGIPSLFLRQLVWNSGAFLVMMMVPMLRGKLIKDSSFFLYVIASVLLVYVLVVPSTARARRWVDLGLLTFQPSELSKLALVLMVPEILISFRFGLILSLAVVLFHSILVALEPDLGTSVLLIFSWFSILFASKVKLRYILVVVLVFALIVPLIYYFGLEDYQRQRIIAFFNPQAHSRGAAYNVLQSIHAIGSGKLLGRGYMSGPANLFGFVPVDHTDFIVAVVGEELGFLGVVLLVALYSLLMFRLYVVYNRADDDYWRLVVVGVSSVIFFHVVENLLMCVGWAPVTGIPLPFVSYGGSSAVMFGVLLGLAMKAYSISDVGKIPGR